MVMDSSRFLEAFCCLAKQKNVPSEKISEILTEVITKAFLKEDPDARIEVNINLEKGLFEIKRLKKVISDDQVDYDEFNEIPFSVATIKDKKLVVGDYFCEKISPEKIDWNMATYVRQFFTQRLAELLNKSIASEWVSRIGEVIFAEVEKIDSITKSVIVNIGKTNGYVSRNNQIPNEKLIPGKKYKFVVEKVKEQSKDWPIVLSRSSVKFVEYELTSEIPELAEKQIKIEKIVRLAGFKTKVAISCDFPGIDPIGSCLGPQGSRIKRVSSQLNGEKIDVVLWDEDPKKLIINAVWPIQIAGIEIVSDQTKKTMTLIVNDEKDLSTIVGRGGKNIKLLTQLVNWGIDVITKADADSQGISYIDFSDYYSQLPVNSFYKRTPKMNSDSVLGQDSYSSTQLRSYTTIVKNDNDIEVDVSTPSPEVEHPKNESISSEPSADKSSKPHLQSNKSAETVESTDQVTDSTTKPSKAKKRSNASKKIDLNELTFDFVQSGKDNS